MAITEAYVTTTGAGAHDGTSEANAYSWAEMVTAINVPATAGTRFNVKAGTYTMGGSTVLTGDGTATSPIIIRGYNSTIGDLDSQGRSSGGALNVTNFPVLDFTGGNYTFASSGSTHLVRQNLHIKTAYTSDGVSMGSNNTVIKCKIENSGTNANSTALSDVGNGTCEVIDCDVDLTGASGTAVALDSRGGNGLIVGCRVKSLNSVGIRVASSNTISNCTIYECGTSGILVNSATSSTNILNCTIVNCTGDGIQFAASTTTFMRIVGCLITGNAYGIDFESSTATKSVGAYNRTRGNTNPFSTAPDWYTATYPIHDITSGSSDYTDAGTDDYSLEATSAAISQGPGYLIDIGANGTPVVTPSGGAPPPRILTPLTGGAFPIF